MDHRFIHRFKIREFLFETVNQQNAVIRPDPEQHRNKEDVCVIENRKIHPFGQKSNDSL